LLKVVAHKSGQLILKAQRHFLSLLRRREP
jgi:hypothetical protein